MGRALPGTYEFLGSIPKPQHGVNQVMQAYHHSVLEWKQDGQKLKVSITYIRSSRMASAM